jgi:hypothetical protein
MNETTRAVIQATLEASDRGQIHFGEVNARLTGVQVESCQVDYRRADLLRFHRSRPHPDG